MLTVDAAFDRIGSAFRQMGYSLVKEERPSDSPGDRLVVFSSPDMSARVRWSGKARLLTIQVDSQGEWIDFAKRGFGPGGLEESSVESLVRAVRNEVAETSTDAG
jgi:hypothetical protein